MATNGTGESRRHALDRKLGEVRKNRRKAEGLAEKHASRAALLRAEEESIMAELLDLARGREGGES